MFLIMQNIIKLIKNLMIRIKIILQLGTFLHL